jgi:hypothetical protein
MAYTTFKSDSLDSSTTFAYIPTGAILMLGGPYSRLSDSDLTALGLIACNGQDILISSYGNLYSVIGTNYNTNLNISGSATSPASGYFRVPNLHYQKLSIKGSSNTNTVGTTSTGYAGHYHGFAVKSYNAANNNTATSHSHNAYSANRTFNTGNPVDHNHDGTFASYNGFPNNDYSAATNGNTNNTGTPRHNHNFNYNAHATSGATYTDHNHNTSSQSLASNTMRESDGVTAWSESHTHTSTGTPTPLTETFTNYPVPYSPMLYFIRA